MNTLWKRSLVPGALALMTAAALLEIGPAAGGQGQPTGGQGTGAGGIQPATSAVAGTEASGSATILVGISPFFPSTNGYVVRIKPTFTTTTLPMLFPAALGSLSHLQGTNFYSFSGGFGDGGNIYHFNAATGVFFAPGFSGFAAVPGLAWSSSGTLYGSAAVATFGDGLIQIDPFTGAGTLVGSGYGGVVGVDAIAEDPTTGQLYGFTNNGYDGSPGDVIIIDIATGQGFDSGIDLQDAAGGLAPCSIGGATFASDGTGYASVGCGFFFGGEILEFGTTTWTFKLLGAGTGFGSMTGLEVFF